MSTEALKTLMPTQDRLHFIGGETQGTQEGEWLAQGHRTCLNGTRSGITLSLSGTLALYTPSLPLQRQSCCLGGLHRR